MELLWSFMNMCMCNEKFVPVVWLFSKMLSQYCRYGLSQSGHGTTLAHFDLDSTAVWLYSWFLLIFTNSTAFSQTTVNLSQLISSIFCASLLFSLAISPSLSSILENTEFPFLSHPSFLRAVLFPNLPRDQRCLCYLQSTSSDGLLSVTQANRFTLLIFKT